MTKRNDGKVAERFITEALNMAVMKDKAAFVRLYDTTSAGGSYIPQQPADFVISLEGKASLLEVKSSKVHTSLSVTVLRSVFSENQILGARLWERAGSSATCAFYSLVTKQFEFWKMSDIVLAYLAPARERKLKGPARAVCGTAPLDIIQALRKTL